MFCQKCGNELQEGASFCAYCGEKIVKPKESPSATDTQDIKHVYMPSPVVQTRKKNKGCLSAFIIILLIVCSLAILSFVITNSKSELMKVMNLTEEQETTMLKVFKKCDIKTIVHVELALQNDDSSKYLVRDSETSKFNENREIDIWIKNKSKKVVEIDYGGYIIYHKGKVENLLSDCYVSDENRTVYWNLSQQAVKHFLNYPDTASFALLSTCRFGIYKGNDFIQGRVQAKNAFGVSDTMDYQVSFDRQTKEVVYLMLDGQEYIT